MQYASKDPLAFCMYASISILMTSYVKRPSHSGCQCPAIRYMKTGRHNIASKMISKVVSEGFMGPNSYKNGLKQFRSPGSESFCTSPSKLLIM
eukprot:921013-Pelagomonas_calceolata.AAC.4